MKRFQTLIILSIVIAILIALTVIVLVQINKQKSKADEIEKEITSVFLYKTMDFKHHSISNINTGGSPR